jgi:hypothetical protein
MSASNDSLKLSSIQKEVLHGTLLGDACLEWSKDHRAARIKFEQSGRHRDYLFHLHELFRPFVKGEPVARVRKCSSGVDCESYLFQTIKHGCFRFFGQQYLAGSSKAVPKLIHRWITPRSFAYWFMDDGSIKSRESKGVLLNTQAFQPSDVDRLIEALQNRLGLIASRRRQRDGLQIYISGKSYDRLVELLGPFVVESMRYKLPPARRTQMPKE